MVETLGAPYTATDLTPQVDEVPQRGRRRVFEALSDLPSLGAAFLKATTKST